MTSKHKLEMIFGGYPKLYSRLLEILGSSSNADIKVVNFHVDSNAADIQIFLKFKENDLPANFQKKSKDFLRFKFTLSNFTLALSEKPNGVKAGEIIDISESHIKFALNSYQYSFSCNSAVFYSFETSSYYDVVDRNFGTSLDDLVGENDP